MPTAKKTVQSTIDIQNLDSTQMLFYLIQRIDLKIDKLDTKMDKLNDKMDHIEDKLNNKIDNVENKFNDRTDKLENKFDSNFKWLIGIMITGFLTMLANLLLK